MLNIAVLFNTQETNNCTISGKTILKKYYLGITTLNYTSRWRERQIEHEDTKILCSVLILWQYWMLYIHSYPDWENIHGPGLATKSSDMWATSHEAEEQSAWEERQPWFKPMGVEDKDPHLPSSPGEKPSKRQQQVKRTQTSAELTGEGKALSQRQLEGLTIYRSEPYKDFEGFIQFDWPLNSVWQDNCDNVFTSRALKKLLVLSHLKTGMITGKTTKGTWTTRRIRYLPWPFNIYVHNALVANISEWILTSHVIPLEYG